MSDQQKVTPGVIEKTVRAGIGASGSDDSDDAKEAVCGEYLRSGRHPDWPRIAYADPHGRFPWDPNYVDGNVSERPIPGGEDMNGQTAFIGRVKYNGSWFVGQIVPIMRCFYFAYNNSDNPCRKYNVLSHREGAQWRWIDSPRGEPIPSTALTAGLKDGETTYIGRRVVDGHLLVGYVLRGCHKLWVPLKNAQDSFQDFAVLCYIPPY